MGYETYERGENGDEDGDMDGWTDDYPDTKKR